MSLLTALTEILDNADSENLSPFDSIPDSELLVSPREGSSVSVGQRCVDGAKVRTTSVGLLIKVLKHRLISGLLLPFSCTGCSASLGHPQNVTSSLQLPNMNAQDKFTFSFHPKQFAPSLSLLTGLK